MNPVKARAERKLYDLTGLAVWAVALTVVLAVASSVVAVVLGAVALHQMKQSPTTYEPSNFPITGIVLGALAALISFGLLTATVINAIRSHP